MRPVALHLVALALVLSGCRGTSTSLARRGPAIACEQASHDFGTIVEGEPVRHAFAVRNVGDAVLTIQRAQGS